LLEFIDSSLKNLIWSRSNFGNINLLKQRVLLNYNRDILLMSLLLIIQRPTRPRYFDNFISLVIHKLIHLNILLHCSHLFKHLPILTNSLAFTHCFETLSIQIHQHTLNLVFYHFEIGVLLLFVIICQSRWGAMLIKFGHRITHFMHRSISLWLISKRKIFKKFIIYELLLLKYSFVLALIKLILAVHQWIRKISGRRHYTLI